MVRYYSEILAEETSGDTMNDAIYERTQRIQDQYDVRLTSQVEDKTKLKDIFINATSAGEDLWDTVIPRFQDAMALTVDGIYFTDLNTLSAIDLDMPWWDTRVARDLSIGEHTYVALGAMNTWTDSHTYAVIFNKELAAEYDIDSYAYVREGTWTLDTFHALIDLVTDDLDGDGVMNENDRYGAASENFNFNVHMTGCGIQTVVHDENNMPVYQISQSFYDAAEKVCSVMRGGSCLIAQDYYSITKDPWNNVLRASFRAGNVLYYVGGLEQLLIFRDLDTEMGLLPMPKYDEDQEEYAHTFSTAWGTIMAIPRLSENAEMASILLEALNADSYYTTAVDYFDVIMKYKVMRDKESYEMLQIIRQSRTMDFEYAFNYLNLSSLYADVLNARSADALSSRVAANLPAAEARITAALAKFEE